jgi:hypothetical protein
MAKSPQKKPTKKSTKKPVDAPTPIPGDSDRHRDVMAEKSRQASERRREIGPLRPVADPERKARCRSSLLEFCRTYFPRRFRLPFAECHFKAITEMQSAVERGENIAVAMPRGSGETALAEVALLHSIMYGYQSFAVLVQATEVLAAGSFKKIKRELETNPLLDADFPEVTQPLRALKGLYGRAPGQTLDGQPTRIEWRGDGVTLPTVTGSPASGAIIRILGIESAGRGLSAMLPDGTVIRPGLVLADDCQTRATAKSPIMTSERETIITDDIMGMVGPGESMAIIKLCTVIYPNDLSERFLSTDKHPEFRAIRVKMIEQFPSNTALWDEYAEIRKESQRSGDQGQRGNDFYRQHRDEMDEGAILSWPHRVKKGDLSGLQTAMNLWIDNPRGFKSEYQNEPEQVNAGALAKELIASQVASRLSGLARCEIPREATTLTCFIDPGQHLVWYSVVAWNQTFGGSVVDYGCWPQQGRTLFAANDPRPSLRQVYSNLSESEAVYASIRDLANAVLSKVYFRDAHRNEMRVERCLIDAGWESATIHQFCRQTPFAGIIYPSKGVARTTTAQGVSEWRPRPGEKSGHH